MLMSLQAEVEHLKLMFEKYIEKVINFKKSSCKELIPITELNGVTSLCCLYDALATSENGVRRPRTRPRTHTHSLLHEKCLNTHFGARLSSERSNSILLVLPDQRFRRRTPGHNGGALVRLQPHLVHLRLCGRGRAQEDRQLPAGDGLQLPRQGSVQSSLVVFHLFDTRSGFDCSVFSGKVTARIV